jgi:hypothetical protein
VGCQKPGADKFVGKSRLNQPHSELDVTVSQTGQIITQVLGVAGGLGTEFGVMGFPWEDPHFLAHVAAQSLSTLSLHASL